MANYVVGPNNSYLGSGIASQVALGINPAVFDGVGNLTVKDKSFLISTDNHGASLTGLWTISVLGRIGTGSGSSAYMGLNLTTDNDLLTSNISIGAKGKVFGTYTGIESFHPTNVVNKGTIEGKGNAGISQFNDGDYKVINKGMIEGYNPIWLNGTGAHTIINSGTMQVTGAGYLGADGTNNFTNYGTIKGPVELYDGNDTLINYKKVGGTIKHGVITGTIELGGGSDTFKGGNKAEIVRDDAGSDTYLLSGGNDTYIATFKSGTDGNDTINGGKGTDTYDASQTTTGVKINLDTLSHAGQSFIIIPSIDANSATGTQISGAFTDKIFNFENAKGGNENDVIYGNSSANTLEGNGGADHLFGFGGNDTLKGGLGTDHLVGGLGKDILWGDGGVDFFYFTSIKDSGITGKTRDVIMDFTDGIDKVHLGFIDANPKTANNDDFIFIGVDKAFTGTAGQLRVRDIGNNKYIVEADVTGNKVADFSIEVRSAASISWSAADDFLGVF